MQENWIGRSEGVRLSFPVEGIDASIEVFTTRVAYTSIVAHAVFA
ncbi:hypothetical protein [Acetomicrobium sp. S15 = DSM 107314]